MKARVMIVDGNAEFVEELQDFFAAGRHFETVGVALNGETAIELFPSLKPDIVLLDIVIPKTDGFTVLEHICRQNTNAVVLSALSHDNFVSRAMDLGARYYMKKPVSLTNLHERLQEIVNSGITKAAASPIFNIKIPTSRKNHDEKITRIFITVGIPVNIKGCLFLREAVKIAIDDPSIINQITTRLYPFVAERFSTTPSKVERAMRHAIEVAWNKGKIDSINALFGIRIYSQNEKPSNGEFIALVADKILLESL